MPVITEQDVRDQYRIYTGRDPSRDEINRHLGQEVPDIPTAARNFFLGPKPSGGGGGGFDINALLESLGGLQMGLSAEERELIKEQIASLRLQKQQLLEQIRLQDIFGEFQAEEGGFEYIRAPSDYAARQQLGQELGLKSIKAPAGFKERQELGKQYGAPTILAPKDKAERATLAQQLGIKVGDLPAAGKTIYQIAAGDTLYELPEAGKLVEIRPGEMALQRRDVEKQLTQRSLQALKGELPISPTLERELGDRESLTNEALRRQLGPGYETSTPGMEALALERAFATETREAARRGELTLGEQLGMARGSQRLAETGTVAGIPAGNFAIAAGLGSQAAGFNGPVSAFGNARAAGNQAVLGAANIFMGGQDLALRNRALDLQRMLGLGQLGLGRDQLGIQRDQISAARDAAMWNAIATGVGLGGGALLTRF